MRLLATLAMLTTLLSCGEDQRIKKYQKIVDQADRLRIYTEAGAELIFTREVTDPQALGNIKALLKQHVTPSRKQKLFPNEKLELYSGNTLLGELWIFHSGSAPYANFETPEFEFGFALTYRAENYLSGLR